MIDANPRAAGIGLQLLSQRCFYTMKIGMNTTVQMQGLKPAFALKSGHLLFYLALLTPL